MSSASQNGSIIECPYGTQNVDVVNEALTFHDHKWSLLGFIISILLVILLSLVFLICWSRKKQRQQQRETEAGGRGQSSEDRERLASRRHLNGRNVALDRERADVSIDTMRVDRKDEGTSMTNVYDSGHPEQILRQIDRLNIGDAFREDKTSENHRITSLIHAAGHTLTERCGESSGQKFIRDAEGRVKRLDEKHRKREAALTKSLKRENNNALKKLYKKQDKEYQHAATATTNLDHGKKQQEDSELLKAMDEAHRIELEALIRQLEVKHDLRMEKLNKEFTAEKQAAILDAQTQFIADNKEKGHLKGDTAEVIADEIELAKEQVLEQTDNIRAFAKLHLESCYNLRQKLAGKMADSSSHMNKVLGKVRQQTFDAVESLRRDGHITDSDAERMRSEIGRKTADMQAWIRKESNHGEHALRKRIHAQHKQRVKQMGQEHEANMENLKKRSSQRRGSGSSGSSKKEELLRRQVEETERWEAETRLLDRQVEVDVATEFQQLQEQLLDKAVSQIQSRKEDLLKDKGRMSSLLRDHEQELRSMQKKYQQRMEEHDFAIKSNFDFDVKKVGKRAEKMTEDQKLLRAHEKRIFKNLMDQQPSMSTAEREMLLRAQEIHLAQLGTTLTMDKLNQMNYVQSKLQERRASMMERMEKKSLRSQHSRNGSYRGDHAGSEDANEFNSRRAPPPPLHGIGNSNNNNGNRLAPMIGKESSPATIVMKELTPKEMKEMTQNKLAILRESNVDMSEDLERAHSKLLEERASALRSQENHLGTLVAGLQVRKAKQLSDLGSTAEALEGLTATMVEDLTDRGVISNPDCHRILEKHQHEQKKMESKLSAQRDKEDRRLREELESRALRRVQSGHKHLDDLIRKSRKQRKQQKSSTDDAMSNDNNSVVNNIADMNVILEHSVQMERKSQDMEREIDQTCEAQRKDFEIMKQKALQDQEVEFIGNLVEMGDFKQNEITRVLRFIFPEKSVADLKSIVRKTIGERNLRSSSSNSSSKNEYRLTKKLIEKREMQDEFDKRALSAINTNDGHHHQSRFNHGSREVDINDHDDFRGQRSAQTNRIPSPPHHRSSSSRSSSHNNNNNQDNHRRLPSLPSTRNGRNNNNNDHDDSNDNSNKITEHLPPRRLSRLSSVHSSYHQ